MWKVILTGIIMLITCLSCSGLISIKKDTDTIEKRTAEEMLVEDHEADIFQYNGLIYSNSKNKEINKEKTLEKGKQVSEILNQTADHDEFLDGTASKLSVGTKIYQIPGEGLAVLAVVKYGRIIIYLAEI